MQITMAQEALADGIRTVARAVPGRHVLASLAGIHLTAGDNALHLQATDLEVAIACSVPASVQAPGSLLLPGRYLQELVRRLPAGPVTLLSTPAGNAARIAWEESACSVQSLPADQYPFPEAYSPEQPSLTISAGSLRRLLRETGFATGHDESRPWFTGVFLAVEGTRAIAMATDAAVVAYSEALLHNPGDLAFSVILPGRALQELTRLLAETNTEQVRVLPAHNRFVFRLGDTTLSTRLLEGQYPDFRRLLPASYPSALRLDRERFLAACERAALTAEGGSILLESSPRGLLVKAHTPAVGDITERIGGDLTGPAFTVPLNVRYVLAGLKAMDSPHLLLEYAGARSAVRFRASQEAPSFFAVLPLLSF